MSNRCEYHEILKPSFKRKMIPIPEPEIMHYHWTITKITRVRVSCEFKNKHSQDRIKASHTKEP